MPREGYTNLSIDSKRYDRLRRLFDSKVKTDDTFSSWAMTMMEDSVQRHILLDQMFPMMHFVGKKKEGGIIIQDRNELVEVTVTKRGITCNTHKGICEHCLFASMHPMFV